MGATDISGERASTPSTSTTTTTTTAMIAVTATAEHSYAPLGNKLHDVDTDVDAEPSKYTSPTSADSTIHRADIPQLQPEPKREWQIILCTLAMCGIQICYAVQINMGSSQLLLLGLSQKSVSLAWLAGPLSGLIVQPIVGIISDSCVTRWGRRRPFIFIGALLTAIALLLFSNALPLAQTFFPAKAAPRAALILAVASFFMLDFSIQAIQGPLRALVTDILPSSQLDKGNAYIAVFTGLGNLIGSLLASWELSKFLTFFQRDVQALFAIAALILCITVTGCLFAGAHTMPPNTLPVGDTLGAEAESPLMLMSASDSQQFHTGATPHTSSLAYPSTQSRRERPLSAALKLLKNAPRPFWRVFAIQLCTWCGFFAMFVYVNTWVGRNVYLGNGNAPENSKARAIFDQGVRLGGKGNALTAIVTLLYSMLLPALLKKFGILQVYAFSQLVEAASLIASHWIRGVPGQLTPSQALKLATLIDIGAFGVVWATTMSVPWSLIGKALAADSRYCEKIGLFTTLFNVSQSFPQLVVAFIAPFILALRNDDPSAVMVVGGMVALVGVFLVYMLRVDVFDHETNRNHVPVRANSGR